MATTKWTIDPAHSSIQFVARHMVITKVRGAFKTFSGTIEMDEADMTKGKVDVSIDVGSIDSSDPKRDGHLKSGDFFDAEKFPKIAFKSKSIAKNGKALAV